MIEVTDERGVEFYFIPDLGSKKQNPTAREYIYALNYLNLLMEGTGFKSDRIGFNGNVETMARFISQILSKYEFENNNEIK